MDNKFISYLKGGDLRSIVNADKVVSLVKTKNDFAELFSYLHSNDRLLVMRSADAIEKFTLKNPDFLIGYNQEIINLMNKAVDKELKWHLALMSSRLDLTLKELEIIWGILNGWVKNKKESRIVRVNSIQALFDLTKQNEELRKDFEITIQEIETENIPSINSRLRKLNIK
ncbi:MAG: hypothetical protein GY931_10370 [Maribacter sp.]|nr:hypothetical protein [Maribacter sp.]